MNFPMPIRFWLTVLTATLFASSSGLTAERPLHLLFSEPGDVCDGQNVYVRAHPFSTEDTTVLLAAESDRGSLWYMPTDVFRDGKDIRIYYQRVEKSLPDHFDQRTWCLGILRGDAFERPDLKLHPQSWPGPANVVLRRSTHKPTWGGFNVFQTVHDAAGGYRLLYWDQPAEGQAGAMLATSTDGMAWTKDQRGPVFTEHNDAYSLVRRHDGDGYLLYQTRLEPWPDKPFVDNIKNYRRVMSLRTSADLVDWSEQRVILRPDDQDAPHTEFYLLKVFRYVDRYAGLLMKYYADPARPGKHGSETRCELIFSRDGEAWTRPFRGTDLGVWSYAEPFELKDKLCITAHHKRHLMLFKSRRDGLASCGTSGNGSFLTQPFVMPAVGRLSLNADCRGGSIRVALVDAHGTVIDGFDDGACRFANVDGIDLPLRWADPNAATPAGKVVRLRFTLQSARVYSVRSVQAEAK